ncbi:MAG TPA: hypothetical protein VLV28_09215 [Gaiellaceae bacterium]|nr:hypothetical protein [Gaiellaceae bacterium]
MSGIATSRRAPKTGRRRLALLAGDQEPQGDGAPIDRDYWLAHCEGYRVEATEGRIGFVDEVRTGPDHPHDTILAVRTGRLGRRILLVPAAETEHIVPLAERIWLRTPVTIIGSEHG